MANSDHDDVLSLDEVFRDEQLVSLCLAAEEWEIIIALAELGGAGSIKDLRDKTGIEKTRFQEVVKKLLGRDILARGEGAAAETGQDTTPDAEVAQYREYLEDMNFYQVLQLDPECDAGAVRRAYFRLMREYHPDRFMKEKNPETREHLKEIFRILTRAYETLSDPQGRHDYDLTIPDFTGALEKQDEQALEVLWSNDAALDPLPETNPDLARSFYDSALQDFQKGQHQAAELNFKLAVALDPGQDDYKAGLAKTRRILHKSQAKEAAIKSLYFEEEGKHRLAIRHMARAVELDSDITDYRFDLARLVEAHGADLNSARMHIQLALDRDPDNIEYLLLFGRIQARLSEKADAKRTFKRILALDKKNKTARDALERLRK